MSFNEKLQILRKEHKLSQEQLADKLNVSRQAVSKWESGASYPEMDKLIALCKLFKCSIDDLTNTDVKELGTTYNKNSLNSIVDELLFMIKKSITMITTMKTKAFISMVISMGFVFLCILALKIPVDIIYRMGNKIFYVFGSPIYDLLSNVWYFILNVGYMILAILLFFYIYKVKYLDNYEEKTKEIIIETKTEDNEPKKEKIIITNAPASEKRYAFFNILGKMFALFMKMIIILFAIPFVFALLGVFALLVIELGLMFQGITFFGILIGTLAAIALIVMILYLVIHALFERKVNLKYVLINSIASIAILGIAVGITVFEISNIKIIDKPVNTKTEIMTEEFSMQEDLKINTHIWEMVYGEVIYNMDDNITDKIIISVEYPTDYSEFYEFEFNQSDNNFITLFTLSNTDTQIKIIKQIIEDLKNNEFKNYSFEDGITITITSSKENIEKIKENTTTYEVEQEQQEEENYYNDLISELENEISSQQTEIDELISKNEELTDEIEEYKQKLDDIKDTINYYE